MIVPEMQGAFAVGSSEGIPVDTSLFSVSSSSYSPTNQITITYTSDEKWDAALWSTFFNETQIFYQNLYQNETLSIISSMPAQTEASLEITSPSGINLTIIKPVYDIDVRRY